MIAFFISGSQRFTVLRPGPLTDSHAQILREKATLQQCAACHSAALEGPAEWAANLIGSSPTSAAQSERCLQCHQEALSNDALFAHSVEPSYLQTLTAKTRATGDQRTRLISKLKTRMTHDPTQLLACSTCHKEHHGAKFDLTQLTNQQCANCHQQAFSSFAHGHPEFDGWPQSKRELGSVLFSHATHQAKHFATATTAFSCTSCHHPQTTDGMVTTGGYETCSKCHDTKLRSAMEAGVSLVTLPTIELESLPRAANPGLWPIESQGAFDGILPPLMQLLLLADPDAYPTLEAIGPEIDFLDFDTESEADMANCAVVVRAVRKLCNELASDTRQTIATRLGSVLGKRLTPEVVEDLLRGLESIQPERSIENWFAGNRPNHDSFADLERRGRQFATVSFQENSSDALLNEPRPRSNTQNEANGPQDDESPSSGTGWRFESVGNGLSYRPSEHADPLMQRMLEFCYQGQPAAMPSAKRILSSFRSTHLARQCTACHVPQQNVLRWNSTLLEPNREFTRFRHQPHLLIPSTQDCQSCHAPRVPTNDSLAASGGSPIDAATESRSGWAGHADFVEISKAGCVRCHTATAAGDDCTKCHQYHAQAPQTFTLDSSLVKRREVSAFWFSR